jgi:hypothetical protein
MKNWGLPIAAVVLAALLGFLYWSNRHKPAETPLMAEATPSEPAPTILALNEAEINKIELKKKGAEPIVIVRSSDGKWQITAPKSSAVDDSAVSGMVSALASLNSERLVEDKSTNPARYGLAEPALEVDISDKHNATHKLLIGDNTPTSNAAYVQLAGDPRIFTIATYTKTSLDKGLNDLRDKRLITADPDKITRFELIAKQQDIEFSRDKEQWQILKPEPFRAVGPTVDELVRKVTEAKMDSSPGTDESKAAATFASGSVIATAKVTTDAGTQQLEIRKNKDDYYAKSSVIEGVYKVASDLGQALDKKLEDFRDKKVFELSPQDPGKIEIHDGAKTYLLTKGGDDWWSAEGKKFDKAGAQALVDKLSDLQASDFAKTGFGRTALEIGLTSADGKRVQKVLLSKGDKNSLARRNNEVTLYVLDAKAIEDLQKLASDLK